MILPHFFPGLLESEHVKKGGIMFFLTQCVFKIARFKLLVNYNDKHLQGHVASTLVTS